MFKLKCFYLKKVLNNLEAKNSHNREHHQVFCEWNILTAFISFESSFLFLLCWMQCVSQFPWKLVSNLNPLNYSEISIMGLVKNCSNRFFEKEKKHFWVQ